jgi:hypothetical protein
MVLRERIRARRPRLRRRNKRSGDVVSFCYEVVPLLSRYDIRYPNELVRFLCVESYIHTYEVDLSRLVASAHTKPRNSHLFRAAIRCAVF